MTDTNNQFWKKRFTTTNIEVVIDDPLKIKDTFITNFTSSDRVLVFESKADGFVEQNYEPPTSPSFVADGDGTGFSVDPEARNEVPVGVYDRNRCVELFNEYLQLHLKLQSYFEPWNLAFTIDGFYTLQKYWTNTLSGGHPYYAWLACVLNELAKKNNKPELEQGLFESNDDYLRRILTKDPDGPLPPIWTLKPFPFPLIPGIEDAPITPSDVPRILENPDLLDDFYRRLREKIKQNKDEQLQQTQSSGSAGEQKVDVPLSHFPPACKNKLKNALDRVRRDLEWLLPLIETIKRLKDIYDELTGSSGCSGLLRLDQEFLNRNLGRFTNLKEYFKFLEKWLGSKVPGAGIEGPKIPPNFIPLTMELHGSSTHNQFLDLLRYGKKPNRFVDALAKLKEWSELPEESRSVYPPLKDFNVVLDSDTSTDEDAAILFGTYLAYNFTKPNHDRSLFADTDAEIEDFMTHAVLFASLPGGGLVVK
jgi:hypothetical protein